MFLNKKIKLLQEYHELRNRYRSMTFLADRRIQAHHIAQIRIAEQAEGDGDSIDSGGDEDGFFGGERRRLWPWQTNRAARIKGVLVAHYNDEWNLLDLTIVLLILWHFMLSTVWSENFSWEAANTWSGWMDLRPTRTDPRSRIILGLTAIFAWFRCLGLMKVHPKLGPMVTTFLSMISDIAQFFAMVWFIMMGFGTAFILLHFDDRDNFSTGIASVYRVIWSGTLGEIYDTTGDAENSLACTESGPFLVGSTEANFECKDIFYKDLLMKVYMFLMLVVFMNLLIAMLSKTYEAVEAEAYLQWRLLLAQTTMEYYENVQHVRELAPFNLVSLPFSIIVWLLRLCWDFLEWTQHPDRRACLQLCGGAFHRCAHYWLDETESTDYGESDTWYAHFRPPWRKIPGEVDVSFKYGGQTLGGVGTLGRRSLYLEEAVGYFPEEHRPLLELHVLRQTSKPGEAATHEAGAHLGYREQDSHPKAWGHLKVWHATQRGGKVATAERDLQDVTLKKATALQVRAGGIDGQGSVYDDDMQDSATDPQVGFDIGCVPGSGAEPGTQPMRRFIPIKFDDRALHVIASDELYEMLEVKPEARVRFSSADLHRRWLDTMDTDRSDSVDGSLQKIMEQVMLHQGGGASGGGGGGGGRAAPGGGGGGTTATD